MSQEFKDFEVVAVDDGSQGGSRRILEHHGELPTRLPLRVIGTAHLGIANALKAGVQAASSPLIARQDADDLFLPSLPAVAALRQDVVDVLERTPDVASRPFRRLASGG